MSSLSCLGVSSVPVVVASEPSEGATGISFLEGCIMPLRFLTCMCRCASTRHSPNSCSVTACNTHTHIIYLKILNFTINTQCLYNIAHKCYAH